MHGHGVCLIKLHQTVLTHKTGLNCTLFHYRTSKLNTDNITIITLERSDTFIAASSFSFLLVILEQQVPNQIYHSLTLCQKSIWGKLSDDCLMGIYIWVTYQRGSPHPLSKTPKLASMQQNSLACTGPYQDETQTVGKLFLKSNASGDKAGIAPGYGSLWLGSKFHLWTSPSEYGQEGGGWCLGCW